MGEVILVRRRGCYARDCRYAGTLGHQSHAVCKMENCLDRGLAHRGDHRVRPIGGYISRDEAERIVLDMMRPPDDERRARGSDG